MHRVGRLTFDQARRELAALGMTITKDTVGRGPTGSGEYRVNYRGGTEDSAYYTPYLDDAVETGRVMAEHRAHGREHYVPVRKPERG